MIPSVHSSLGLVYEETDFLALCEGSSFLQDKDQLFYLGKRPYVQDGILVSFQTFDGEFEGAFFVGDVAVV